MSKSPEETSLTGMVFSPTTTPWPSIYICGLCAFIQASQFTIYFSSIWPYLKKLDPEVSESTLGYIVAMYSVAQCLASPLTGYWSNRIKQVRVPLVTGFCFMLIGNLLYFNLQFFPIVTVPFGMMASRFITGAGTGNAALLRAYVATTSTLSDRSRAIATVSGGIAVGTMAGPALQLLFVPLGEKGVWIGPFLLNIYNAPALLSMTLNVAGIVLVTSLFQEQIIEFEEDKEKVGEGKSPNTVSVSPDTVALAVCVLTRFSQIFMVTTVETVGSPYSMMMFWFNKEESVTYNAAAHAVAGATGAVLYFFFIFKDVGKLVKETMTTIICLLAFLFMYVVTYSWPFLPNSVQLRYNGSDEGCDLERFDWCSSLTLVSPWVYYTMYILCFGVANSFMNIAVTTLYSKIIGPRRQGTLQGIYQMAGSIGRMISPVLMSRLYILSGPTLVWQVEMVELAASTLPWILLRRRMVPFGQRKHLN